MPRPPAALCRGGALEPRAHRTLAFPGVQETRAHRCSCSGWLEMHANCCVMPGASVFPPVKWDLALSDSSSSWPIPQTQLSWVVTTVRHFLLPRQLEGTQDRREGGEPGRLPPRRRQLSREAEPGLGRHRLWRGGRMKTGWLSPGVCREQGEDDVGRLAGRNGRGRPALPRGQ